MEYYILRTVNVEKYFSGLRVLDGISMDIPQGKKWSIIGPNGAGKTTLFNVITGMYKPTLGKIFFNGRDITGFSPHRISQLGIARSFQIINIFPNMTVFENVRNGIVSKHNKRYNLTGFLDRNRAIAEATERILDSFGLRYLEKKLASEISYADQRKLEIAISISIEPVLIMLDEPSAGLNPEETLDLIDFIYKITEDKTLLIIEHDMDFVFKVSDFVTVINYGKEIASGTPQEIQANEEVRKAYLGDNQGVI